MLDDAHQAHFIERREKEEMEESAKDFYKTLDST
jgi:hypothetical protein